MARTHQLCAVFPGDDVGAHTYTAEPGSKSAEALDLLASWTATLDEAEAAETLERA